MTLNDVMAVILRYFTELVYDVIIKQLPQFQNLVLLECGPMPNLMVALPNIGGALCSTPQSLADAHY